MSSWRGSPGRVFHFEEACIVADGLEHDFSMLIGLISDSCEDCYLQTLVLSPFGVINIAEKLYFAWR